MTAVRWTMGVAKCKATFLSVLNDVEKKREIVTITKHGRPVAKVVPLDLAEDVDPLAALRYPGFVIAGDVTSPCYTDEDYEEFYQRSAEQLRDLAG